MIGFVGLSHLGIVSSIAAAAKGFEVVGCDPDPGRPAGLTEGRLPFFEPELDELLGKSRSRIRFTADLAALRDCEVVYFSLDIPTDDRGRSDLAALERLIEAALPHAAPGATLVVLSQVTPGFTRRLAPRVAERSAGLRLYYQVETLIFGRAVERAMQPERTIIGCADPEAPLPDPYAALLEADGCPLLPMRYESAELTKISINMCLVATIAAANTLAELCEEIGADWSEMVPALRLDRRIGQHSYLSPGLGIAGGNLERDLATVSALAAAAGTDAGVVHAWIANSRYRRDWALRTLHAELLARVPEPRIAVWGLAYKPDTTSTKNSPSLALLESLRPFSVRTYDPQVTWSGEGFRDYAQAGSPLEACRGADALVVMTPWRELAAIEPERIREAMRGSVLIDPYHLLDRRQAAAAGFTYFTLGTPPEARDHTS